MNAKKLTGKVNSIAAKTGIPHQNIYDMYFFERFLYRLSLSEYSTSFVVKGGFLLENIVGAKARTTTDIDLKAISMEISDEEIITEFTKIAQEEADDGIVYTVLGTSDIAAEMKYGGKSVKIEAHLENLKKIFNVDIAQGDVVTPYPQNYTYISLLDGEVFEVLAYTKETIIAEKFETLIEKGMNNSRAKDLFDIHILLKENIDYDRLNAALINTFYVRGTKFDVAEMKGSLDRIQSSEYRRKVFENYARKSFFAQSVTFDEVIQSAYTVLNNIKVCEYSLPKSSVEITLVRHGEDEQDKVGGWSDNVLTETGFAQVEKLAETLVGDYDLILSSDLPRAKQTVEIIAKELNCEIIYDERLRETNNGDLKNLTKEEFIARGYKRFIDMGMDESYPNGESPNSFFKRVNLAFTDILQNYNGKKILLVTHGGVITVIQCLVNSWQYSNMLKIVPPYASKIEIEVN